MLYYLFTYLHKVFGVPGFGIFRYITFRAGAAAVTALILAFWLGPPGPADR
jgi:phospho-N-acetylmuramoyl-pentapeptide-transferase